MKTFSIQSKETDNRLLTLLVFVLEKLDQGAQTYYEASQFLPVDILRAIAAVQKGTATSHLSRVVEMARTANTVISKRDEAQRFGKHIT